MVSPQPYPVTELFAWIIDDPSGKLAIVGFMPLPNGQPMQAVTSKRHVAEVSVMQDFAKTVALSTGYAVRLQRFVLSDTVMEFKP